MEFRDLIVLILFSTICLILLFSVIFPQLIYTLKSYKIARYFKNKEKYMINKLEYEHDILIQKINIKNTSIERYIAYSCRKNIFYCIYPTMFKSIEEVNKNITKIKKYIKEQWSD